MAPPREIKESDENPTPDGELLRQGLTAFRSGRLDPARKLIAGAIALNPKNEDAWLLRASMARSAKEAEACLKRLLLLNPAHAKGKQLLAKLEGSNGRSLLDLAVQGAESPPIGAWRCPICEADCEKPQPICENCRALVDLGRVDEISRHEGADRSLLLSSVEKLSARETDFDGCISLALAHLNLKSSHQAVRKLEAAREIRPEARALDDVIARLKQRPLVMVVDDSKTLRRIVSSALEKRLFRVCEASDGSKALAELEAELPRAFLVDAEMPEMSGYEVCKALKRNDAARHAPVILLGEEFNIGDRMRGKMAGAADYLTKPFTEDALVDILFANIG